MQTWRYLLAAVAVLFMVGVLAQFLLIGLALTQLGGTGDTNLHINVGYWLQVVPLVALALCWPARTGRRTALLVAALFVDTIVQGIFPLFRNDVPAIAALHPVNALIVFGLGAMVARRAVALARSEPADAPAGASIPATPPS
jgi:cytochrome b